MRLQAQLTNQTKQLNFATQRALNAAAYSAAQATKEEMKRVFDKPTAWVMGSVRYIKAKRDKLEAQVDFDFWGNKQGVTVSQVLKAEIYGGVRRLKRFEVALQRRGILPSGHAIVPGPGAEKDVYGNISTGQITQILSWFSAFGEQGYRANMRDGGKRLAKGNKKTGARGFSYFALFKKHGKLIPGIYKKFSFGTIGSSVKPIMYFVTAPKYKRLLDFYGIAERAALKEFNAQFPRMFDEAMRTAR
jgi:hypothetical protein